MLHRKALLQDHRCIMTQWIRWKFDKEDTVSWAGTARHKYHAKYGVVCLHAEKRTWAVLPFANACNSTTAASVLFAWGNVQL